MENLRRNRANATVYSSSCLSDTIWLNHQRIRQYAGGHDETRGGVTLNFDSDLMDGAVASLGVVFKPFYHEYLPLIVR